MAEIDSAMEEKLLGDDQNAEGKKEGGIARLHVHIIG